MHCPSCGEEIPDDSEFCRYCGTTLTDGTSSAPTDSDTEQQNTDEDGGLTGTIGKAIAYLIGGFLILSGLAGFLDSIAAALVFLLGGIIALPIVRAKFEKSQSIAIGTWATVAIVIVAVVAGGALYDGNGSPDAGSSGANTDSEDMSTPTPEPTPTPTPEPEFDSTMGESFVVGEGDQSVRYVVHDAFTTDVIEPRSYSPEEAEGVFIIVIIEMENVGDEAFDVRTRHLKLVDQDGREFESDTRANLDVGYDHRIETEGITSEQLQPGLTIRRAVVFDVVPDQEYRFKIEPVGAFSGADEHYFELEAEELE
jgi:hypothetical protein